MDLQGLRCSGCGSTNVEFDPQKRLLRCNQCGKEEYYSRATLNANGKVVFARQNALRFFAEGQLEDARYYAMEILNIFADNAPAMFMLAYYDEFKLRKPDSMKTFFYQISDVALEYDEVRDLRMLILKSAYNLGDFEESIIPLIAQNMQSPEDTEDLCEFIDAFCPYQIKRHSSSAFLTQNLIKMYRELVEHCGIPKTCFSLLKLIETNPDSPYVGQNFYLKAKTRSFFEHYVLQIGQIFEEIRDPALKDKFLRAYHMKCEQYKKDAGIV